MSEFWKMTMYELKFYIEDYAHKQKQKQRDIITLAYYTAGFSRAKKLPKFERVLKSINKGDKPKKKMTVEEMFEQVKINNSTLGGEVNGSS